MKEPSIASVKDKIQEYRKTRKNKRQAFPAEILSDTHHLLKSNKKSKLKKELQITDSIINRGCKQIIASPFVRVAPVIISDSLSLNVEVLLHESSG